MPRLDDSLAQIDKLFTQPQLEHFGQELSAAGCFDQLMEDKQALIKTGVKSFVVRHSSATIRTYSIKYLRGPYDDLKINSDTPYHFWELMLSEWRKYISDAELENNEN